MPPLRRKIVWNATAATFALTRQGACAYPPLVIRWSYPPHTRSAAPLLEAGAANKVTVRFAVMTDGYMMLVGGKPPQTAQGATRLVKTPDAGARLLLELGVADLAVKPNTA